MKTVHSLLIILSLLTISLVKGQQYEFENSNDYSAQEKTTLDSIRYYYYPNLEAYFDTKETVYIYKVEREWVRKATIPSDYRGYSIYNNRKEALIGLLEETNPEKMIDQHKKEFPPIFTAKQMKFKLDKDKASRISYSSE